MEKLPNDEGVGVPNWKASSKINTTIHTGQHRMMLR